MSKCTIATHLGNFMQVAFDHNRREEKLCSKEDHIDLAKEHETWLDIPIEKAYEKLFGDAVKKYNEKQNRSDRKIENYYSKIEKAFREQEEKNQQVEKKQQTHKNPSPCYEMIVGVYETKNSEAVSDEEKKEILKEFAKKFVKKYPNLKVIGAYYHADEKSPHLHLDFIPVAHNQKRGLENQPLLEKALNEMGYFTPEKVYDYETKRYTTSQTLFEKSANDMLAELCKEHQIEVFRREPTEEKIEHLDKAEYIAKQKYLEAQQQLEEAQTLINTQQETIAQQNEFICTQSEQISEQESTLSEYKDELTRVQTMNDAMNKEYEKTVQQVEQLCNSLVPTLEKIPDMITEKRPFKERHNDETITINKSLFDKWIKPITDLKDMLQNITHTLSSLKALITKSSNMKAEADRQLNMAKKERAETLLKSMHLDNEIKEKAIDLIDKEFSRAEAGLQAQKNSSENERLKDALKSIRFDDGCTGFDMFLEQERLRKERLEAQKKELKQSLGLHM